ncbi:MAG: glycosyltransferase family 9 protein [Prevotella sp.]|jgi:ADP-heptose:LPS heptosyltransferase|nr:glycosyltransferase family 9 protein [Prevotella sp.]
MAKVLVIRISSFGDVAMLVPVIFSVAAGYPQDRFSVMTRKAFAPLFENLSFNINVIPLDINGRHKGVKGMFRIIRRLASLGFSHVADEHDVIRSKFIRAFMTMTGRETACINKGRKNKKALIANRASEPPLKSTIQRYQAVFDKLGFPAPMIFTNILTFIPKDFSGLRTVATEKTGTWIGIAPFSKHKGKIFPLEKMEKVISKLSGEANTTIFLFGAGKEESRVLTRWAEKYPNVKNATGKLNLEKELLLISYLDVMVSMDSANMHLASLVHVPVVSIWGATHPSLGFYGFNQDPDNAVQIDLDCRPCSVHGNLPCQRGDYACLERIHEDLVISHIHKVLEQKNS